MSKAKRIKKKEKRNINTIKETKNKKNDSKEKKNRKRKKMIITAIQIVLIGVIAFCGFKIYEWNKYNKKNKEILNEISNAVIIENVVTDEQTTQEYVVDFQKLKEKNSECVGYIKINGLDIAYPVVKHKDNDYYLTHNFENAYNSAGWIFADYKNKVDGTDKNLIIYGHNRRDGSMFSKINTYALNKEWYDVEENRKIKFITEKEDTIYEVFSIYKIEDEDYYIKTEFYKNEFPQFLNTLKKRSIKNFGIDVTESDNILTLSTCDNTNKYRVVIHAKKLQN